MNNMPTIRQKKLAKKLVKAVESGEINEMGQILESVGYSRSVSRANPGATIAQKGVQEELKILGFDPDTAKSVVASIMGNVEEKARDRLTAADMTFKVHGTYAPVKAEVLQVNIDQARLEELTKLSRGIKTNVRTKYVKSN